MAAKKQVTIGKKWRDGRQLGNTAERNGQMGVEKSGQTEAAKKQSRKKWTYWGSLKNKAERSGLIGGS